jgi:HAMP domain-containing protein/signal transduction histidine kinase
MNKLYNLSIRKKFAVVIVPLIVIIILFDILQIRHKLLDYQDSNRLNKAIIVGVEINHLVHELQKERSISSGYLSNNGDKFSIELTAQRIRTDSTLVQFLQEIEKRSLSSLVTLHAQDLNSLKSYLDRLVLLRKQVDDFLITPNECIKYYSSFNEIALNTVNKLINETRDKEISQQVHAMIYFLKSKERASIERAIGTKAFSTNHIGFDLYHDFSELVAQQEAYLDAFLIISDDETSDFYTDVVQGPDIDAVKRMRTVLFANEELSEDPNRWYEACTNKINALKVVEDHMSVRLDLETTKIATEAGRELWGFIFLDLLIGLIAFYLMSTIVSNLLENVRILEAFTRRIIKGDLSEQVHIGTRDELGQYAKTFNVMVQEIKISHQELEKQRDRAKFLYQNIYQVSKVVFENIQQGIFLLDKNFKISKFHSKAMEQIFDNKHIAGENFASFMRPLIIPRELEALEMFMRHLFNEDMDEDVVNQLNPVEQVKIYTENNGVVATKYVRIKFTRIIRNGKIQHIMVTVSDETESILLQQHLDEAERKKKEESEQVLSILKIDPSVLRGFIHNSKKTLRSISERYEGHQGDDYTQLLDFTFTTIHNLKGNAIIIGLKLMGVKFHEIEESLTKLKGRKTGAKDFLTILYEMDEADRMLTDMAEMLKKVASIYRKLPPEGQAVSNIMVIDSLEKGVETISAELSKNVDFVFKNENDVIIPESYINSFKDIMIQLIKNSISHGIEAPNVRLDLGKMLRGTINLELDQTPDKEIVIKYSDDGKGLNLKEIREKAVQRNILSESESEKLKEKDIVSVIFTSGFSISDKADHYSGRGQGLSLVKNLIEELGGNFEILFEKGRFFQIIIRLPHRENDEPNEDVMS